VGLRCRNPPRHLNQLKAREIALIDTPKWDEKYIKDGKVLDHLEIRSKILPEPLTDLSAWVGFCTSSPQQDVKYQLSYLIFF
jgi:hypothetical protein